MTDQINCCIYKSPKKQELYLFLAEKDDFSSVPPELMKSFGEPEFVMELTLTPERKLARSDSAEVIASLQTQGFHIQMPPKNPLGHEVVRSSR